MARQISLEEVAKHNKPDDCWVIVNHHVYDVTSFLDDHPAGRKIILLYAGKDATEAFLDIHNESYFSDFLPAGFRGIVSNSSILISQNDTKTSVKEEVTVDSVLLSPRTLYLSEHTQYRERFKAFIQKEVLPYYAAWENRGKADAKVFYKAAQSKEGFYLNYKIPTQFGGRGLSDFRYSSIIAEELEYHGAPGVWLILGNDMVVTYFLHCATPAQQQKWLPRIAEGNTILAVAMSEPECGSDLAALKTTATRSADGKHFTINGRKMWISEGRYLASSLINISMHMQLILT